MHPNRRQQPSRVRCAWLAALALLALAAPGCAIDPFALLNGDDDWLSFDDECDHPHRHAAAAPPPAGPPVAFPPNTR